MPSIVLIGQIGSGKTTLYNKITGSSEKVQAGNDSVTRAVFQKNSLYGAIFTVYDTPGTDSQQDKMKHCGGILAAINQGPLNRIMIIGKLQTKIQLTVDEIIKRAKAFERYKQMITAVITWFDTSKNPWLDKLEIIRQLQQSKIESVMFVGFNHTAESVCKEIDQILSKKESAEQQVELLDQEIFAYFDLIDSKDNGQLEKQLQEDEASVLLEFIKICNSVTKKINDFPSTEPDISNKLQSLMNFIKSQSEEKIDQFLRKNYNNTYVKLLGEDQIILIYYRLKKFLQNDIEKIAQLIEKKLKENKDHYLNFIKRCNYCSRVWLKVEGCEKQIFCGSVPTQDIDKDLKKEEPLCQYDVKIKNNVITFEQNQEYIKRVNQKEKDAKKQAQEIKAKANKGQKRQKITTGWIFRETFIIGEEGCGNELNWGTMISLTDKELKELVDPGVFDYYKAQDLERQKEMEIKNNLYKINLDKAIQEQINLLKNKKEQTQ